MPGDFLLNGIVLGALVTTDMEDITIPLGGDHTGSRTFVLEQGVGRDGGPVINLLNVGELDPVACAEVGDAGNDANRRVRWCCGDLVDQHLMRFGVGVDHISKGPTDVYPNQLHRSQLLSRAELADGQVCDWAWGLCQVARRQAEELDTQETADLLGLTPRLRCRLTTGDRQEDNSPRGGDWIIESLNH